MKRLPVIIYIGAGILAWTAGKMLVEDKKVSLFLHQATSDTVVAAIHVALPLAVTAAVIIHAWFSNAKSRQCELNKKEIHDKVQK